MNEEFVICEGWLKKQENFVFSSSWTLKYFQLRGTTIYQFGKSPQTKQIAESALALSKYQHVTVEQLKSKSNSNKGSWEYFFRLTYGNTTQDFCCETLQQCKEWIIALSHSIPKEVPKIVPVKPVKSEKEKKMEESSSLLINTHGKLNYAAKASVWVLEWYRKVQKKVVGHKEAYDQYFFVLHNKIKEVEHSGQDFSENTTQNMDRLAYHLLELLNVFGELKMKKLEKKDEFLRWQMQKLWNDPKSVPILDDYMKEIKELNKSEHADIRAQILDIEKQIDEALLPLEKRFKEVALSVIRSKKEKISKYHDQDKLLYPLISKMKQDDDGIVLINDVKKQLVESLIQYLTKKRTLLSLHIDCIEGLFEKKKPIDIHYLYLTSRELNKDFWKIIFQRDQRIVAVNILVDHLFIERKTVVENNISQFLAFLDQKILALAKKLEDFQQVCEALEREINDIKTGEQQPINFNYLLFAETKLQVNRLNGKQAKLKWQHLERIKLDMSDLEKTIQKATKLEKFKFESFETRICIVPWKDLYHDIPKETEYRLIKQVCSSYQKDMSTVKQMITISMTESKPHGPSMNLYEIMMEKSTPLSKYLNMYLQKCKERETFYLKNGKQFMIDLTLSLYERRQTEEKNEIFATIEKFIFDQVYHEFMTIFVDSEMDLKFVENSEKNVKSILKDLLKIEDVDQFKSDYEEGIHLLIKVENQSSPSSKLISIYCALKRIMEIIESKTTGVITTDDFLPVCICTLALSGIGTIFSQIKFIRSLGMDSLLLSEQGYYLSSLESAATFVVDYKE